MIDRRTFLAGTGAVLLAAPLPAEAQPASKVARVGLLHYAPRQFAVDTGRYPAFVQSLRELGYVEGTSLVIEARFADGNTERLPGLAAEIVRLKVDVIVASGTAAVRALRHVTTTIPIVLVLASDPVGDGFAASLARPGGNITGFTLSAADFGPKMLDLLKAAAPKASRVAVLVQPANPAHPPQFERTVAAAQKIGIQTWLAEAASASEIERAFATMAKPRVQGVIVLPDGLFQGESRQIATHALKLRLPSISVSREYAEAGGLMTYGANSVDNFRRAASYVDKILKGAKPGELPFEQPTKFELVINLKTAKALGLTFPPSLLGRADEVIQ